ncbi:hypothetical protein KBY58_09760 [Cyanobium sp. HWJ4-Hawea]|uniref:hypothetical protein n=1 Tax=Cyanobium sp. HWJ4-Hawea TaxID=2823713 RepID=UPI0020CC09F4|nr:hypothetical protein [Cyanobium sp. HWJ4-Hawea]MCP9809717.1 hypothetical protein [Cyanobium sp. HWJ4-Hawea]
MNLLSLINRRKLLAAAIAAVAMVILLKASAPLFWLLLFTALVYAFFPAPND